MNALVDAGMVTGAPSRALLALGWGALVLAWVARRQPAPRRIRRLHQLHRAGGSGSGSGAVTTVAERRAFAMGIERVSAAGGRWAYRVVGRHAASAAQERRLGRALLVAAAVAAMSVPMAAAGGLLSWALPGFRERQRERRRLAGLAADLPDVVDLLVLAVGAGLTVALALDAVSRRASGPLSAELAACLRTVRAGRRLADVLEELPARAGEVTRPLSAALVAAERYGAPLAVGLDRLAGEVRRDRRRAAEEAARKVPVKLLFPLVTCSLPAFGLLTVAPLVASGIRSLPL